MGFTINGTALEQNSSPSDVSDLIGLANVTTSADGSIVDTSFYDIVHIEGEFNVDRTLVINRLKFVGSVTSLNLGLDENGDKTFPANLTVLNGSTTAFTPILQGTNTYTVAMRNSSLNFINGGFAGYYAGGYVYDSDESIITGKRSSIGGSIGVEGDSILDNTRFRDMAFVSFFGSPSSSQGFQIEGDTLNGAFIDRYSLPVELRSFSSPRYTVQKAGKFDLIDSYVGEHIALRANPTLNSCFFTFFKTIQTQAVGANANADTTRYVYDSSDVELSSTALDAQGELSEEIQWGKVYAGDLPITPDSDQDNPANKMTPTMINTNTGTYKHMTGEYKLPLSVAHISYKGNIDFNTGIEFDVGDASILSPYIFSPNLTDDLNITESNPATVLAYTTIDDAFELYDRAKSYLYDNYLRYPATIVGRSGSQIVLGSVDLVINASAVSAFAFSTNTITIDAVTFTGGATATTGTVTTQNGTLLNGGTFDCDINYESGAGTTLTNVTCTGVLDFDTAGTYTLSSCTINEVTNSSGGAVTLNLSGSTVTTNTGPSITLASSTSFNLTGLIAGSEVRVYEAGTTTEIDGIETSGTTFATTISVSSVDLVVFNTTYLPVRTLAINTSVDVTLPIQQIFDRNYENP